MKTRLLAGLTALVLGAFTSSCSNILEENGVINNVAESGMGELRINLSTDASLNVSTKATENVTNITDNQGTITVTTIKGEDVSGSPTLPTKGGTYKLPLGTYKLSAQNNNTMTNDFDLVADILRNMSTKARADILGKMTPENAAKLTAILEPDN